jgi:hypothetical protein
MENVEHEAEVISLFEQVTVEIPNSGGLRAISLEGFKIAINQMMNKAFYHGQIQAISTAESIMDRVFS